jgi:hypothetical protein
MDLDISANETIVLQWQPVGELGDNQWYEVRFWRNGNRTEWMPPPAMVKESKWEVPQGYNPGKYGWGVAVILVENDEYIRDLSTESEMWIFNWEAPPPVSNGSGKDGKPPPPD